MDRTQPTASERNGPGEKKSGPADSGEFITVARVTKPQGRIGEVAATILTDFPERFSTRKRFSGLGPEGVRRELKLEDHWFHKEQVILKFAGVDSITQAEELAGWEVQLPRAERAELERGSVYVDDLAGCIVWDRGREVGRISDVQFGAGEAPLLIIQGEKEYMVPLAAEFLEEIDLERKQVTMKLPEGMLELDAPLSREEKERQQQKD
jgi:16S rRNA processing protein RimM